MVHRKRKKVGRREAKPKVLKVDNYQIGKVKDLDRDKKLKALPSGKRMSKSGRIYYEHRKNRSDLKNNV